MPALAFLRERKVRQNRPPRGLGWRSSVWFITFVVGLAIAVDLTIYSMIVPVIPYRLAALGYDEVSSKTSYLLLAYSLALVLSTPPIVWIVERLGGARRLPLLVGLAFMAGALILFMLAPNYTVFVIARILQGCSGSVVWVVGLALLCDAVPEDQIGQQLGLAMTGSTIGFSAGPPIGGALYDTLGFLAPFIFGIIIVAIDFGARLFVVEPKDAAFWKAQRMASEQATMAESPTTEQAAAPDTAVADLIGESERGISAPELQATAEKTERSDTQVPTEPQSAAVTPALQRQKSHASARSVSLSSWGVLRVLVQEPRAMASVAITVMFATAYATTEPTISVRLDDVYGLNSLKVGLIYIAAVVPTLFSGAFAGWLTDRYGPEYPTTLCFLLSAPWWMILAIRGPLPLFIVAIAAAAFFVTGPVAPLTAELANTARTIPGITYGHVFGAWNIAYSIGNAIGPLIGGQIYDHAHRGWLVLCILITCLVFVCAVASGFLVGPRPLFLRWTAKT